ncbi:MAG: hypothetical protein OEV60_13595 [Actinomycetota bacterium]|nr:hypothetical protein [Actinomycetota bacterium]MDH5314364.1 hypothetical protein [Actinomycetota bacterium]
MGGDQVAGPERDSVSAHGKTSHESRRAYAMRSIVPFVIAALVVLVAVVAIASPSFHSGANDPNDTKGLLDVRRVRLAHKGGTEATVIMFASWSPAAIWDRGNVYVFLDTSGADDAEYFVLVRSTGSGLQGSLWRDRRDRRDVFLRTVKVRRKTGNGVSVAIPIKSLEFGGFRTSYFWWATTTFTGRVCRRTCVDRAPDDGSVEQWRPGMSPSPSPTNSPSPSP